MWHDGPAVGCRGRRSKVCFFFCRETVYSNPSPPLSLVLARRSFSCLIKILTLTEVCTAHNGNQRNTLYHSYVGDKLINQTGQPNMNDKNIYNDYSNTEVHASRQLSPYIMHTLKSTLKTRNKHHHDRISARVTPPSPPPHSPLVVFSMHLTLTRSLKRAHACEHKRQSTKVHKIHRSVSNDSTTRICIVQYNTTHTIFIIIYFLTARVVGAPKMISQPVFSIFSCSPLPSGTCRTPGLSIS